MTKLLKKIAKKIQKCNGPKIFPVRKSSKAETLLEVIVATAVFMIIMAPASSLYISNVKNSAMNKNDLIGAALAEEAIEMVKNIRDTNLLKFSANADANGNNVCWATRPDPLLTIDNCSANQIGAGSYRIDINTSNAQLPIRLSGLQVPLNLESLINNFRLALDEISEVDVSQPGGAVIRGRPAPCGPNGNPAPGGDCHNHFQHDTHLYVHSSGPLFSPFYRELKVDEMLDLNGTPDTFEEMRVTATVVYMNGSKPRVIERTIILTYRLPSI